MSVVWHQAGMVKTSDCPASSNRCWCSLAEPSSTHYLSVDLDRLVELQHANIKLVLANLLENDFKFVVREVVHEVLLLEPRVTRDYFRSWYTSTPSTKSRSLFE